MTTTAANRDIDKTAPRCGCCGRAVRIGRLVELGNTPGVFICDQCALWAARRSTRMPVIRLDPRAVLRWLGSRARTSRSVAKAIPILPSADLDRTSTFYQTFGMEELARYEGYLLMGFRGVELHFSSRDSTTPPGEAFVLGHIPVDIATWSRTKVLLKGLLFRGGATDPDPITVGIAHLELP